MKIIPAIDLIDGKCVRLTQGDYAQKKVYNEDPLEVAKAFEDHGIRHLHLVDLDGARSGHIVNHDVLSRIANATQLHIDFGGGLKTPEDVRIAFDHGAQQVTIGSIAAKKPDLFLEWFSTYGPEKLILGADSKDRKVAVQGWKETIEQDVVDFIHDYVQKGVRYVICTDIARDGMLTGTADDLYREIIDRTQCRLIASGGVSSVDDLTRLKALGCEGVIIGKAIYENRITLDELNQLC